ncbi:MAG: hypothetical protein WD025_01610 [Bacteriovoracaceae bacterium]
MSIQEEIHKAMRELQAKSSRNQPLDQDDMRLLFLTSLIEEEADHVEK